MYTGATHTSILLTPCAATAEMARLGLVYYVNQNLGLTGIREYAFNQTHGLSGPFGLLPASLRERYSSLNFGLTNSTLGGFRRAGAVVTGVKEGDDPIGEAVAVCCLSERVLRPVFCGKSSNKDNPRKSFLRSTSIILTYFMGMSHSLVSWRATLLPR